MNSNLIKFKTLFDYQIKKSYIYFDFEMKNPVFTNK